MIDVNKTYRTRGGQEVTQLFEFELPGVSHRFIGVIDDITIGTWSEKGQNRSHDDDDLNLIEVPVEQWHFVFENNLSNLVISNNSYPTEELAIDATKDFICNKFLGTWKLPDNKKVEVKGEIK